MTALQRVAACVLMVLALPLAEAADGPRRTPFTHFGTRAAIELKGDGDSASVDFGSRGDELVTRAAIHFRYAVSPAMAPTVSHVRLALNDQVIGVLPTPADRAGQPLAQVIEFDPRLIVGFNKLVMTLVATKGAQPPDPARPGLWAEVSGASELELAVTPLVAADELAALPEPFFDRHDPRRVVVPFVFAPRPDVATLRASAVVASWFGQHARWRGVRFPTSLGEPAPGHAVAFVANDARPAFLASLPPATGPALRIMANPADHRSKLLLVMGRDGAEVKAAADALVLGGKALSGAAMQVKRLEESPPRAPWDAPAFVRTDRPVKLGELLDWPQQLESTGRPPLLDPVSVDLRVPPDLDAGDGPGVPLTLKLQYTPPACVAETQLEVSVSDQAVQVLSLRTAPEPIAETRSLFVPAYRLRGKGKLQMRFRFTPRDEAACREVAPGGVKAVVLPDSTIDFSTLAHRARMPDLEAFATAGFPFTRMADLSQTVVVLPDEPTAADIETMLGLLGRLGEATGYPATRVRLAGPKDAAALEGADVLLVGSSPKQSLLDQWADRLPVAITGTSRRLGPPARVSFEGAGPIAAMAGFESPVSSGRSVVAVSAIVPEQMLRVLDALDDADQRKGFRGAAAFVLPGKVEGVVAGRTYHAGGAQAWDFSGSALSRPWLVVTLAVGALAIVGGLAWAARRRLRRTRDRA